MGFTNIPSSLGFTIRNRLIIGVPEGHHWGLAQGDSGVTPCQHRAIEGLLYGFRIKQEDDKNRSRLQIFLKDLETNEVDMIASGFQTNDNFNLFAKSFCLALCSSDFNHELPIILSPEKGEPSKAPDPIRAKKIVFCGIYQNSQKIKTDWTIDIDCRQVLESLTPNFPDVPLYYSSDSQEKADEVNEAPHYQDLFEEEAPQEISFQDLMTRNNAALKRLGWSQEQGREYLVKTYGKKSRQLLSDEQLIEFTDYLESLVSSQSDFEDF